MMLSYMIYIYFIIMMILLMIILVTILLVVIVVHLHMVVIMMLITISIIIVMNILIIIISRDYYLPSSFNFIGSIIIRVYIIAIKSLLVGSIPSNVRNPHLRDCHYLGVILYFRYTNIYIIYFRVNVIVLIRYL